MKRIIALFVLMLGVTLIPAPAANAGPMCYSGWSCGRIWRDDDSGYGAGVGVIYTCNWNTKEQRWLYRWDDSARYCQDVDGVYARPGEEVWVLHPEGVGWWGKRCGPGPMWCKLTDSEKYRVVLRVA